MAVEVVETVRDNKGKVVLGKGVEEFYPYNEQEFSEEVMRIVRGTNMFKNCQGKDRKDNE